MVIGFNLIPLGCGISNTTLCCGIPFATLTSSCPYPCSTALGARSFFMWTLVVLKSFQHPREHIPESTLKFGDLSLCIMHTWWGIVVVHFHIVITYNNTSQIVIMKGHHPWIYPWICMGMMVFHYTIIWGW